VHATIQKPLDEIIGYLQEGESVFVVGCGNCAAKARSGGRAETEAMKRRLEARGVRVTGWAVTDDSVSLCKLSVVRQLLGVQHKAEVEAADSCLILACGQGIHTVMDATDGGVVHPGCDTVFGGETVTDDTIVEYCQLCGECVVDYTGGLCPLTLCAKGLLNGPCGGSSGGMCEVFKDRECGWHLIYERLKGTGRLDLLRTYRQPKSHLKRVTPRTLRLDGDQATFTYANESSVSCSETSGSDSPPQDGGSA